jgi:3-hydroxyisobutyrate dehydrogenase-like beta-hydroxyacid dehydrogenase
VAEEGETVAEDAAAVAADAEGAIITRVPVTASVRKAYVQDSALISLTTVRRLPQIK